MSTISKRGVAHLVVIIWIVLAGTFSFLQPESPDPDVNWNSNPSSLTSKGR